ncbi:MAG: hypothetical protein IH950_17165, partial [Bacteroidetes bacterium]|nr:hypothetical protein [Bacteroidota bacterium]
MKKLTELWKVNCDNCEAVKPILTDLEKDGYEFERHNITSPKGKNLIAEYKDKIIENNKKLGFDPEYLYTPTFLNSKTSEVLAFEGRAREA